MENLILLCRHHHSLVHEGGYDVKTASEGEIYFTDPHRQRIPDCPETHSRGSVSELSRRNFEAGLNIDFATGLSHWKGEPMDASAVIEVMQKREGKGH